jgi:hypothetical protein
MVRESGFKNRSTMYGVVPRYQVVLTFGYFKGGVAGR